MSTRTLRLAMAGCMAGFTMAASNFAVAQSAARAHPADAKAEAPVLAYESPLKGYRRFEEQTVTSWRGANDLAQKLGGWKAFASGRVPDVPEGQASGAAPSKPAPPEAPAPGGGHAGHKTK